MPTSVRLDPETESLLNRLARTRQQTKSDILREALHRLAQAEQAEEADYSPYDRIADLVGIARSGPDDLARQHKRAFQDLLITKKRR